VPPVVTSFPFATRPRQRAFLTEADVRWCWAFLDLSPDSEPFPPYRPQIRVGSHIRLAPGRACNYARGPMFGRHRPSLHSIANRWLQDVWVPAPGGETLPAVLTRTDNGRGALE